MRPRPLDGLRVLDLSRLLPGPTATLYLADLGADVIKIEDPGAGDYMRTIVPGTYAMVNRNKRSVVLDLKSPDGVESFLKLAETADAVLEGFRPGVMDRLGLGYEAVRARNPAIVYCSLSGFGQTGPYADKAGHDLNYLAFAGLLDQQGAAGGPPVLTNFQIADLAGGALSALVGMLAALLEAKRTGEGRHVDISMTDCAMALGIPTLAEITQTGHPPARGTARLSGGRARYRVYECADGRHLAVGALEDKFWKRFCETIGRPDLASRDQGGQDEADAVAAEISAVLKTRDRNEWAVIFERVDCCVSPVLRMDEAMENPQIIARDLVRHDIDQKTGQEILSFNLPIRMSELVPSLDRPAPAQGEHTAEVLGEVDRTGG